MFLIASVKGLENVLSDELIVGVHIEDDRVRTAVVMRRNINVLKGSFAFCVLDVSVARLIDTVEIEVFTVDFIAVVGGCIVDDYNEVVCIVLLKY